MNRICRVLGTVATISAVTLVATSSPAHAADTPCSSGYICVNEDGGYEGGYLNFYKSSDNNYTNNFFQVTGRNVNDRASSLRNYNCSSVVFYRDINGVNIAFTMGIGSTYPSLGANNDVISGHVRTVSC